MKLQLKTIILSTIIAGAMISCGGKKEEKATDKKEETKKEEAKSEITLDKTEFKDGEDIKITYKAVGEFGKNAWIGIIPADKAHGSEDDNDKYDVAYQYFTGTEGTLTFKAPKKAGEYDFRMHTTDASGKEVAASKVFKVTVVGKKYGAFAEGVTVAAKWGGNTYYAAVITKVDAAAKKYDVAYEDGTKGQGIAEADLKMIDPDLKLNVGDNVQAVWTDAKFYEGVVEKVDGKMITVKWKDGSSPSPVELGKIFKQ